MAALNPKQRQALARKAAKARWKKTSMPARKSKNGKAPHSRRNTFGAALVEAERRLAEAINERNYHSAMYHQLNNEIPNLQRVAQALRAQQGQPQPSYQQGQYTVIGGVPPSIPPPLPPDYSMDNVLSDGPLPMGVSAPGMPSTQVMEMPPVTFEPPMTRMPRPPLPPRGGGGAIGKPIEEDNEDIHLRGSGLPGGEWR